MANKRKQLLPYFRQSRLQDKTGNERQRGAIYNDKRVTPPRRHVTYKYIFTQQRNTKVHTATINKPQRDINNNTIIVGDLNTPLTSIDRSSRQKVNKEIVDLNEKLDQMDLIDI